MNITQYLVTMHSRSTSGIYVPHRIISPTLKDAQNVMRDWMTAAYCETTDPTSIFIVTDTIFFHLIS